jgi:hypothetical protein
VPWYKGREEGRVIKSLLKPRTALPMGFALGLFVLWELGALPMPFGTDLGPIGQAALAVGLAVLGAMVGFLAQWLVARLWSRPAKGSDADTE